MVAISKYTIDVKYKFDRASIKQVDDAMKLLQKKINAFSKNLQNSLTLSVNRFDVDQRRLNITLGNALDRASNSVVFQISRFNVDQRALTSALSRASSSMVVGSSAVAKGPRKPSAEQLRRSGVRNSEWDRQQQAKAALFDKKMKLAEERLDTPRPRVSPVNFGISPMGVYGAGLALVGGGYGLSQLNQRNQQVVSAQLQTQATVQQFGGTAQQGQGSFEWLRSQANRIGFNYLDASADYNKLLSGLMGSGFSLEQGQGVFKGFAELSRVNKLDRTTQNRLFRALSQVAGKDQLMSEELTGQIAEALPGGVSLFAEAYRRQTGGDLGLNGSQDIKVLLKAMKDRKVKGDILGFAAQVAAERAAPGLGAAMTASQAEQARYQNTVNDLAVVASGAGVEEGFARIFRTLNAGLSESNGLVRSLANGFNEATKWADDLLLFPQSFARALEGKDSLVADWLGADATAQLRQDWQTIKESMETISNISAPAWLPTLEKLSKDIADQMRIIASLSSGDFSGLGESLKSFVSGRYETLGNAVATGPNFALRSLGEFLDISTPQVSTDGFSWYAPKNTVNTFGLNRQPVPMNPLTGENLGKYDAFSQMPVGPQESNKFGERAASLDFSMKVLIDGLESGSLNESYRKAIEDTTKNWFSMQLSQTDLNFSQTE